MPQLQPAYPPPTLDESQTSLATVHDFRRKPRSSTTMMIVGTTLDIALAPVTIPWNLFAKWVSESRECFLSFFEINENPVKPKSTPAEESD